MRFDDSNILDGDTLNFEPDFDDAVETLHSALMEMMAATPNSQASKEKSG